MKPTTAFLSVILGMCVATVVLVGVRSAPRASSSGTVKRVAISQPAIARNFAKLPLHFEPNLGQSDSRVKFLSRQARFSAFLTTDGAVVALQRSKDSDTEKPPHASSQLQARAREGSPACPSDLQNEAARSESRGQDGGCRRAAGQEQLLHRERSQEMAHECAQLRQGALRRGV